MIEFIKKPQIWHLNVEYEKIYNCRPVIPTYEKWKWIFNSSYFLDKRLWMIEFHSEAYKFTDTVIIDWIDYYLYSNDTEQFLWVKDWNEIKKICWPFNVDSNSPFNIVKWYWAKWNKKESNLLISNWATFNNSTEHKIINEDWIYEDWYIVLDVWTWLNITAWDMVLFKDNIYKGSTLKVELYENGKIYVLWLDNKWSVPTMWDTIDIFDNYWIIPVIWNQQWVIAVHINWTDNQVVTTNILEWEIKDIEKFNGSIFALKWEVVYFSQVNHHDNLEFYSSSDRKRIEWAYKLVSNGKFMIVFWDDNRLVSPLPEEAIDFNSYTFYSLNYQNKLYSKYSYYFTSNRLYIIESNRQISNINISSLNSTAFNLETDNITETVRWLTSDIWEYNSEKHWEIFINKTFKDWIFHILYHPVEWWTIEYNYDDLYKHWIVNTYSNVIYRHTSKEFLIDGWVHTEWWYTDLWEDYKQDINFTLKQEPNLLKFLSIRNVFWINNEFQLKLNIEADIESSSSTKKVIHKIWWHTLDVMPIDHSLDMLNIFNNWNDNKNHWNIVSIQRRIFIAWRYCRVSINSTDRFIYWYSVVYAWNYKKFINERWINI